MVFRSRAATKLSPENCKFVANELKMIILDKPYVSDFLLQTIEHHEIPVVQTPVVKEMNVKYNLPFITEDEAIARFRHPERPVLYSNSENAINWISTNLHFTDIPDKINLFKDKVRFRELIRSLYPEYYFESLELGHLEMMEKVALSYPVILKPAVGFFSMGVYKLNKPSDWKTVQLNIREELDQVGHLYPNDVFNATKFILEACIQGREFAIDAYYDADGQPVILNIMEHYFSSSEDVSDRLYTTSSVIIRRFMSPFYDLLASIGELAFLRNFPVHVEVRLTEAGEIIPIEVNPMRFGGWCTTADLAAMAFGFNPYHLFFSGEQPDWDAVLRDKENKSFNIIILDNSTGYTADQIKGFDSEKLLSQFDTVLDYRPVDFHAYPIFGFLFAETNADNSEAVEHILKSDLQEYLITNES